MNFLHQGFRKLSCIWHTYVQTDKQAHTTEIIYHAATPLYRSMLEATSELGESVTRHKQVVPMEKKMSASLEARVIVAQRSV